MRVSTGSKMTGDLNRFWNRGDECELLGGYVFSWLTSATLWSKMEEIGDYLMFYTTERNAGIGSLPLPGEGCCIVLRFRRKPAIRGKRPMVISKYNQVQLKRKELNRELSRIAAREARQSQLERKMSYCMHTPKMALCELRNKSCRG